MPTPPARGRGSTRKRLDGNLARLVAIVGLARDASTAGVSPTVRQHPSDRSCDQKCYVMPACWDQDKGFVAELRPNGVLRSSGNVSR